MRPFKLAVKLLSKDEYQEVYMKRTILVIMGMLLSAGFLSADNKISLSPFFTIENTVITQQMKSQRGRVSRFRKSTSPIIPVMQFIKIDTFLKRN